MTCDDRSTELEAFIDLVGREAWQSRIDAIVQSQPAGGRRTHCGRDVIRRHAIEIAIQRQRRPSDRPAPAPDRRVAALAVDAIRLHRTLDAPARQRFEARLADAMQDGQSLTELFHLLRTAWLHRSRGFEVAFAGFANGAPFDLLLTRDGSRAEVACEVVSAESGRGVHQGAWFQLADMVDPDLQAWLSSHPGRYLLKMTLPRGLRRAGDPACTSGECELASLHRRIKAMLAEQRRADQDPAAVMRLDPLVIAASQAAENGLLSRLRSEFGPETQLAVSQSGQAVFVMAAHAGAENDVPAAIRRRMESVVSDRLTGRAPGILAMYVDDIDEVEWGRLARDMTLEGETRQFLTRPEARHVVTVACTSRHEMLHPSADDGEYRFRNPAYRVVPGDAFAPSTVSLCWNG